MNSPLSLAGPWFNQCISTCTVSWHWCITGSKWRCASSLRGSTYVTVVSQPLEVYSAAALIPRTVIPLSEGGFRMKVDWISLWGRPRQERWHLTTVLTIEGPYCFKTENTSNWKPHQILVIVVHMFSTLDFFAHTFAQTSNLRTKVISTFHCFLLKGNNCRMAGLLDLFLYLHHYFGWPVLVSNCHICCMF